MSHPAHTVKSWLRRLLPSSAQRVLRDLRELPADSRGTFLRGLLGRPSRTEQVIQRAMQVQGTPTILVLCYGNIYRSPFAYAWLAQAAERAGLPLRLISAGLHSRGGRPAPDDAQAAALEHDISLAEHRSACVSAEDVRAADLILVMDRRNEAILLARHPEAAGKVMLLGVLDPLYSADGAAIPDPYGQGDEAVRACYARIVRCAGRLLQIVSLGEPLENRVTATHRVARKVILSPMLEPVWARMASQDAAIVMMHRFEDREAGVAGHSPELLAAHLEFLRHHRFNIESLDQLVTRLVCGEEPPPRTVVFTADDGHGDFARVAAPVLERFDCPATLFLTTGFVDGETWLWYDALEYLIGDEHQGELQCALPSGSLQLRWRTAAERFQRTQEIIERLKHLPLAEIRRCLTHIAQAAGKELPARPLPRWAPITWAEVEYWGARGMRFGAHSVRHPILANESAADVREEILGSWARLKAATPYHSQVFAYPNGTAIDFGARERQLILESGLIAALRSDGGHCTRAHARSDRFALPRIPYSDDRDGMRQQFVGAERFKAFIRGNAA